MVTNKTFSQYLKNKIKSKGSLIFFAIPALWIASFLIYSFITKKEFLLKTLKSYSGIFSRAITSGDWEMVVSLQKNLNITFEIFNIHLEKLGELHSKANYGLFPYCETIKSSSISEENITGCIHILNLNDIFIISTLLLIMVAAYFLLKKQWIQ